MNRLRSDLVCSWVPIRQMLAAAVSKSCLVRFDTNKYSVTARAVGQPVEVHAYAERIVNRQDGEIVAEHAR